MNQGRTENICDRCDFLPAVAPEGFPKWCADCHEAVLNEWQAEYEDEMRKNQGRSQKELEDSAELCAYSGAGLIITLVIVLICGACNAGNAPQLDRIDEGAAKELSVFWPQVEITYQYEDGVPGMAREAMIAALAEWRTEWPHYRYREVYADGNVLIRWDKSDDEKLADTTITLSDDGKHIAKAVIVVNSRHRWPHPIFSLARTLAHEWGHALGLGHSLDKGHIMYPVQVIGPVPSELGRLRKLMGK